MIFSQFSNSVFETSCKYVVYKRICTAPPLSPDTGIPMLNFLELLFPRHHHPHNKNKILFLIYLSKLMFKSTKKFKFNYYSIKSNNIFLRPLHQLQFKSTVPAIISKFPILFVVLSISKILTSTTISLYSKTLATVLFHLHSTSIDL
jgi:hypothetical protein